MGCGQEIMTPIGAEYSVNVERCHDQFPVCHFVWIITVTMRGVELIQLNIPIVNLIIS